MKKYNRNEYLTKKEYHVEHIITIIIGIVFLLIPLFLPIKESILCSNKICSVRDSSILMTKNQTYNLNNINLYVDIGRQGRGARKGILLSYYIRPISKCNYISANRAENDMSKLLDNNKVCIKHISMNIVFYSLIYSIILLYLFFYNKRLFKYYKYFFILFLIRLIYILVI